MIDLLYELNVRYHITIGKSSVLIASPLLLTLGKGPLIKIFKLLLNALMKTFLKFIRVFYFVNEVARVAVVQPKKSVQCKRGAFDI